MRRFGWILIAAFFLMGLFVWAACPSTDLDSNCRVDLRDFALLADWWLSACSDPDWCDGADFDTSGQVGTEDMLAMAGQWLAVGQSGPLPVTWVAINEPGGFVGQMSRYMITNAQYAQFLNDAWDGGLITLGANNLIYGTSVPVKPYYFVYANNNFSQIFYDADNDVFGVRTRDGYDMSNHPVTNVTWYGAKAFCDYYGYRLPMESEWQAVADYDGSYLYGCGTVIDPTRANYNDPEVSETGWGNNPLDLSDLPYTTPGDYYPSVGYGVNDMAGNANEWTASAGIYNATYIIRGGSYSSNPQYCTVTYKSSVGDTTYVADIGFRVCRNNPVP